MTKDNRPTKSTVRPDLSPGLDKWQVAPGPQQRWATWIACRDRWLATKARKSGSEHTRRAYTTAWEQFFSWTSAQGVEPWQVTTKTASAWVEYLADEEGLAASTVNAKIAALSSFFTFASEVYTMTDESGVEQPLQQGVNPFRRVERPQVQAYGKAVYPTQEEVRRLLVAINLETARGWRDRAIVLGLLTMAQRFNAWLTVTWEQIYESEQGGYLFTYRAKGGHMCKAAIHEPVMQAVEEWLRRSGRWPLEPHEYVFVADEPERATRLPNVQEAPEGQALSNSTVNGMLQALARRAGVDPAKVHAHGLRHAGARWMRAQGADVWDLQRLLGHKSISTTQIYIEEVLDEPENPWGAEIARQLGLDL